jgi:hypothetical protein
MQPQRLVVPLFQRPYVWNQENQWEPLWDDVVRVAERVLANPQHRHHPHFLGAVVLQQVQNPVGRLQERTIIDGQQRLTTLQLLLDALHAELMRIDATGPAMRIEMLVSNAEPFCSLRTIASHATSSPDVDPTFVRCARRSTATRGADAGVSL